MTVNEFIEWLKTMPQDAQVNVLCHDSYSDYCTQGGTCSEIPFIEEGDKNGNECFSFVDFSGNQFVKPDAPYYGKKFLTIGMQK